MKAKLVIKNILSSLAYQLVSVVCGFITPALIIRTYGSEVNGLLSSITQFLAYIALLESGFGPVMKAALYKPLARKNQDEVAGIIKSGQNFFKKIAIIFVVYIVILLFVYPLIVSAQFDFLFTMSLILIMGISTFFEYYLGMAYKLFLQASQKTYVTYYIQIATLIISTICTVVLIKVGAPIQVVKMAVALIYIARPIAQNLYVKKHYRLANLKATPPVKIKQKWHGLAQHIAAVVHGNTDVAVLTIFGGNIALVSVYAVYMLVVNGVKQLVISLTSGIDAMFGDLYAKGEGERLTRNFRCYELLFHTLSTTAFVCCLLLIVPFVKVYTAGVTDADYVQPVFAVLIVLAEFMHSIRLPYSSLTLAVGHFKETMIGAWVESGVNILLSIILVWKFGLIGVAIGTLVAMFIRTLEFMYHTAKHVLNISLWHMVQRLVVISLEVSLVCLIVNWLPNSTINNYLEWAMRAIIVAAIAFVMVAGINILAFRQDAKLLWGITKRRIKKFGKKAK